VPSFSTFHLGCETFLHLVEGAGCGILRREIVGQERESKLIGIPAMSLEVRRV
jgi:hypothetical protein